MFKFDVDKATATLRGPIGPYEDGASAADFDEMLAGMGGRDFKMTMYSPGGEIPDGMSIYHQLAEYPGRITMKVDTLAGSMASVVMLPADHIEAFENSEVMIHNPWTFAMGDKTALREIADVLDTLGSRIANLYANRTGKPADQFVELMNDETWFSASEAMDIGLIDSVIIDRQRKKAKNEVYTPPFATISAMATKADAMRKRIRRAKTF